MTDAFTVLDGGMHRALGAALFDHAWTLLDLATLP